MKKILLTLVVAFATLATMAQRADYRIIPLPKSEVTDTTQVFVLQSDMSIAYDASNEEVARNAAFLKEWVQQVTGVQLVLSPNDEKAAVRLSLGFPTDKKAKKGKKNKENPVLTEQQQEAYTIAIGKDGILIQARQPIGFFRAAQTLRKALPFGAKNTIEFPFTQIQDEPRFAYRGVHFDCSRHFFKVDFIKKYLDLLALHGCNQFHWHLTDNDGWRFEVKALPDLAKKGGWRDQSPLRRAGLWDGTPYGGHYTQEECREVIQYAAERYINIIPEIDMPAHIYSALQVYPNLCCDVQHQRGSDQVLCAGNPETLTFLKTIFGELCDVFPSKFIHIGGDECPKGGWQRCPKCQAKIKELGLKDDGKHSLENQLQTWMNREIGKFLSERGRDMIGWDEILEGGLTEGGVVMSWRGVKGGIEAAKQHHRVIMTPTDFCYFDYYQLKDHDRQPPAIGYYLPVSKVYSFEPLDGIPEEEQQYILGAQANLWTEYVGYPQHVYYMLLPRLDALCEVQWCRPDQKDYEDFKARLTHLNRLYDRIGVNYCRDME
jgi:hexosaminidase